MAEEKIIEVACMLSQGPLASAGILTLTNDEIHFEPTGRLDKMIGVKSHRFRISDITGFNAAANRRLIAFTLPDGEKRFTGKGVSRFLSRFEALMAAKEEPATSEVPKPALAQGTATLYKTSLLATRGDVILTASHLLFRPSGGLESLLWDFPELNIPVDEIENIQLTERRMLLEVTAGGNSYLLGGEVVNDLNNRLLALGVGNRVLREYYEPTADDLFSYEAVLQKGLLRHSGELTVSPCCFTFSPKGRVSAMTGANTINVGFTEIEAFEKVGERGVKMEWGDESCIIEIDDRDRQFNGVVRRITEALQIELTNLTAVSGGFEGTLSRWGDDAKMTLGEPIVLTGPVLHWENEGRRVGGWLALTDSKVLLLPCADASTGAKVLTIPLNGIKPKSDGGERRNIEIVEENGTTHTFTPLTGEGFVDAFWMLSTPIITEEIDLNAVEAFKPPPRKKKKRKKKRKKPAAETTITAINPDDVETRDDEHTLERIIGQVVSITFFRNGNEMLHLQPAHTVKRHDGVGVLVTGAPGMKFRAGSMVEAVVTQPEGSYTFSSRVVHMGPVPAELVGSLPRGDSFLTIEAPEDLVFRNRRASYRVAMPHHATSITIRSAAKTPIHQPIATGWLQDISTGGCSAETEGYFPDKSSVELSFILNGERIELGATLLHTAPPSSIADPWVYGFRFTDVAPDMQKRLNRFVIEHQRQ